jgi:5-methylcytosine-specific restriction endonuclease McrA
MKRTELHRYTPLKAKKPMNKVSKKQRQKNIEQDAVKQELIERMMKRDGYLHCEECGKNFDWLGGSCHHDVFRSHGGKNSVDNEKILCSSCHSQNHNL